tara:strand:+ start:491 stop:1117 length:627 start_codon:yes stop_codon:yes gene_type:complete
MSFGYLGDTSTKIKQQVKNQGVLSISDVYDLEKKGHIGGSLELIESKSISGASSAIFDSIKETEYDIHYLQIINYAPVTDSTDIRIRFFESGTEESASVYRFAYQFNDDQAGNGQVSDTSETYIRGTFNVGNDTNERGHAYHYFYDLGDSSKSSFNTMMTTVISNNGRNLNAQGGGVLHQQSTVDQIKLFNASGNFSCTAKLYGIKKV